MRYVLIMAGGSGKRLWPLSRQDMPKQLLRVVGGKSLLRIAYERLDGIVSPDHVLVCTSADYADIVAAELPELKPVNILGEPEGRDSLNAVAWPAAVLAARDPDAVVAVVTSDHIMHPVAAFQNALLEAFEVAESGENFLVTFGVVPTGPHTGRALRARHVRGGGSATRCWWRSDHLDAVHRHGADQRVDVGRSRERRWHRLRRRSLPRLDEEAAGLATGEVA